MKVWLPNSEDANHSDSELEIGCYHADGSQPPAGALVRVNGQDGILGEVKVAGWVVPAGLGGDTARIHQLATTGRQVIVAINGLGAGALAAVHEAMGDGNLVHLFDARDQDRIPYLEQLAWLRAQNRPFAVMTRSQEKLNVAAAASPQCLIIPERGPIDLAPIQRIAAAGTLGEARPISEAEIDHLLGAEASLTVVRPMAVGAVLSDNDLTVAITETRGLSPSLRDKIAGKSLRYAIKPGEPLHFGHLIERPDHE